jgi:tripartite-type tricarboxylate transporter receptor subunit TctC
VVFVAAGTPAKIIRIEPRAGDARVKEKLSRAGTDAAGGTSEEFAKFICAESEKWRPVVKSSGVQAN